jgi:hypothetical protein
MNRKKAGLSALTILVVLLLPIVISARPVGKVWWGGFSLGNLGWNSGGETGEMGQVSLYLDPLQGDFLSPSLYLDAGVPLFPPALDQFSWGGRLVVTLFTWKNHPGALFFDQKNWYSPALSAGITMSGTGAEEPQYLGEIHLARIRTGDGTYSFFPLVFALDRDFQYIRWGVRIFEFSYFLF